MNRLSQARVLSSNPGAMLALRIGSRHTLIAEAEFKPHQLPRSFLFPKTLFSIRTATPKMFI